MNFSVLSIGAIPVFISSCFAQLSGCTSGFPHFRFNLSNSDEDIESTAESVSGRLESLSVAKETFFLVDFESVFDSNCEFVSKLEAEKFPDVDEFPEVEEVFLCLTSSGSFSLTAVSSSESWSIQLGHSRHVGIPQSDP